MDVDEQKLNEFMGALIGDLGGATTVLMVCLGDELGLYEAMDGAGPVSSATLAERTSCNERLVQEWLDRVGSGVAGYVTPKITVGAVVGNDAEELLMIQRADSGVWLYPTGWADVGYSPAEVVVKEVYEETGIECEVIRPIAILDGQRRGFTRIPLISLVFHCRMTGGTLDPHPLECSDVGWFREGELPEPVANADLWAEQAFRAIRGEDLDVQFDRPRTPPWRGDIDHEES